MSFFQNLATKYPTWQELSTYLSSEEGGAFRIRECGRFAILQYKKGITKITDETAELRSVVWDTVRHAPVCVAPAKARAGSPPCGVPLRVQEFLDGVMINAFKVLGDPKVHIVSRSQFDAAGTFYSKKSFGELFKEALPTATLEDLFSSVEPTEATPAYFASFVLQHPEHRVVYRPPKPAIYCVDFAAVTAEKTIERKIAIPGILLQCMIPHLNEGLVFQTEEEMMELVKTESLKRGWTWQGLVFFDAAGNRWRLRNPTYTYLRGLRGNDSAPEARFLRLRSQGKISEYLKHYADERDLFWSFEEKLRAQTQAVYDGYCAVHKSHEKTLADIPHPLKTLVFRLHSHYIDVLRPQKIPIQKKDAIDLANSLPLWEQQLLLKAA